MCKNSKTEQTSYRIDQHDIFFQRNEIGSELGEIMTRGFYRCGETRIARIKDQKITHHSEFPVIDQIHR